MAKPKGFGRGQPAGAAQLKKLLAQAADLCDSGEAQAALALYRQILAGHPELPEALHGIGLALHLSGDHQSARAWLGRALARRPDDPEAHCTLGFVLFALGQPEAAIASYRQAVALGAIVPTAPRPEAARRYLPLGYALEATGQLAEAAACYRQAIALAPDFADAHYNLGNVLERQGERQKAAEHYKKALAIAPSHARAHNNLAHLLHGDEQFVSAEHHYRQALAADPSLVQVYINLGTLLESGGRPGEAIDCFEQALAIDPSCGPALWHARLCLPVLYDAPEEITFWRNRFARGLESLIASTDLTPAGTAGVTPAHGLEQALAGAAQQVNFYLQYQGCDDTALQRRYGEWVHRVMTAAYPQWNQPLPFLSGAKLRIGFASSAFVHHSGTRWLVGWLAHLDRSRFALYCYHTSSQTDAATEQLQALSDVFHHIASFEAACQQILADQLHVLLYPDIGMEPRTTQMAALRLAPVQCTAWGHPVTSGLPTIDYFLSGAAFEPENAQAHYSETLVRLPKIGVCYPRPPVPQTRATRADFGLAADRIVYFCCQSLFKYLPQYDRVFVEIAQEVPNATFLFVAHKSPTVTERFGRRVGRAFAAAGLDGADFCRMLARQSYQDYLQLLALCDVFLDTFDFSGGNTTLEALALGLPVVTCPGALMRGRLSFGMLQVMGISETSARNPDEYVQIAVRLGQDPAWRAELSRRILAAAEALFDDRCCVEALAQFFASLPEK